MPNTSHDLETSLTPRRRRRRLTALIGRGDAGVAIVAALLIVGFGIASDGVWLGLDNMRSVLQVTAILAILAYGEALVITTGEIDISVGSVFGTGALVYLGAEPMTGGAAAVVLALAAGMLIGMFNGLVTTRFGVSSLIVTLGTLFIFRGIAYALTGGFYFAADAEFRAAPSLLLFGGATVFGFNVAILWALGLLGAMQLLVFYTPIGNHLLAVGGDAASAASRGVRVDRVKLLAFTLAASLAALAGVLEASKIGFADGSFGRLMELEAIAAAVMGGCALAGGRCSLIGTLIGAFVLSATQSFLVIMGIQPQWYMILLGLLVVISLLGKRVIFDLFGR